MVPRDLSLQNISPEREHDGEEPLHGDRDGGVDGAGAEGVQQPVDHRQDRVVHVPQVTRCAVKGGTF